MPGKKVGRGVGFFPFVYPVVVFYSVFQPQIHDLREVLEVGEVFEDDCRAFACRRVALAGVGLMPSERRARISVALARASDSDMERRSPRDMLRRFPNVS